MNKLWKEGLCNNAFSQKNNELQALMKEDKIGMISQGNSNYPISDTDTNPNLRWEWLGGMTSDVNDVPIIGATSTITDSIKVVISADTEYPREICRLVDYFYSEEGISAAQVIMWYAENDKELGSKYYLDEEHPSIIKGLEDYPIYSVAAECKNQVPDGYDSWETYKIQKLYINSGFNMVTYTDPNNLGNVLMKANASDEICDAIIADNTNAGLLLAQIWKHMNEEGETEVRYGYPIVVYAEDVIDERASLITDITLICEAAHAEFITGEKDPNSDADWNEFLNNLKKAGLDRLIAIEQASYDAANK